MTEKEIFAQIEEKKSLIKKINDEINSLEHQIHLIYKEKILSKFKIGDILVMPKVEGHYTQGITFKLEFFDSAGIYGYARTSQILYASGVSATYDFSSTTLTSVRISL